MNETVACKLSPVKTLAVSAALLRELLNILIYFLSCLFFNLSVIVSEIH